MGGRQVADGQYNVAISQVITKMAQVQNFRLFLSPISSKRYQETHRVAARPPCSVLSSENIQEVYDAFVLSQFVLETFSL
jgi:hypothetical protein